MDDDAPRKRDGFQSPNLDAYSLDDLSAYRAELEAEIARVDAESKTKAARMDAAANLFKS